MYDINFEVKDKAKGFIKKFFLHPEHWADSDNQLSIPLTWQSIKFSESNLPNIPLTKGIYCFVVKPDVSNFFETSYLFYIGKTDRSFHVRYSEYLRDQKGKNKKARAKVFEMLKRFENNLYYYYAEIDLENHIAECEEKLLNTFIPHINTQIPIANIKSELKYIYE